MGRRWVHTLSLPFYVYSLHQEFTCSFFMTETLLSNIDLQPKSRYTLRG